MLFLTLDFTKTSCNFHNLYGIPIYYFVWFSQLGITITISQEKEPLGTGKLICSLRADEIKLWLTPSAKQHRNPCSGIPAVYPDLSTRHDWPLKKAVVLFVVIANQVEFETHFR